MLARSALDPACSLLIHSRYVTDLTVHSQLVFQKIQRYLHCALSLAAQCIVIGPVCGGRRVFVGVCVFVCLLPQ